MVIRAGSVADGAQIAAVQREGWFAAYEGIIPAEIIDRVTAPDGAANVLDRLFGTLVYAVGIGPLAHIFVPLFSRSAPDRAARTATSTTP